MISSALLLNSGCLAFQAGLTLPINNGQVEGHVTRIKLIKRMMYGKAGFALFRQRVLHRI
jgi:transposase